jgi:chromosome segregation ATPase
MYDELNTKYLEQQHELQNIALTARQILDEKIDLKAQVERLTKQNALATPRHLIASQDIKTLREQIEELKLENSQYEEHHKYGQNVIASLRAEVERLSKPAIIGGYNLSEYIRMANSETLEFDNGDIFADMTLPERIKYIVESHARLKAEVERLQNNCDYLDTKLDEELEKSAMLCGQVERLTDAITRGASTPDAHPHA